jgi:hypothetical protein
VTMEGRGAMWAVAGPLIGLKLWATGILLVYAPTREALAMVLATGWPWLVALAILLGGPTVAWLRLVRVRARRARLRRAEWMLDEADAQRPPWETVSPLERDS